MRLKVDTQDVRGTLGVSGFEKSSPESCFFWRMQTVDSLLFVGRMELSEQKPWNAVGVDSSYLFSGNYLNILVTAENVPVWIPFFKLIIK